MKLLSIFLSAAFVGVIKGQTLSPEDCYYDYICDDAGSPEDLVMSAPSPLACYEACRDYEDPDDPSAECLHWTYYEEMGFGRAFDEENYTEFETVDGKLRRRGKPVCRRLTSCAKRFSKDGCESAVGGTKCASGPGSCEPCDMCDKLNAGSTFTAARWVCNIIEPYRKAFIPPGTTCRTTCPSNSWSTDGGTTPGPVTAKATCVSTCSSSTPGASGVWTLDNPDAVDGDGTSLSPVLDSECLCDDIPLEPYQLPGANSFQDCWLDCDKGGLIDGDDGNGELETLGSTSFCELYCHNKITKIVYCEAGSFTADVKTAEDLNCLNFPKDCEYTDFNNADVCKCSVGNVCLANEVCLAAGTCLEACTPGPDALLADCFCEATGATCTTGNACKVDGTCGAP